VDALQKYKRHYQLTDAEANPPKKAKTFNSQGKKRHHEESEDRESGSEEESLYRIDLGAWRPRINKNELAATARSHFNNLPHLRENEAIVHFLYHVKMQGWMSAYSADGLDQILKLRVES
jgi:hypothetical protein